jgi:peptide/nickel transport system permease protein
MQWAGLARVIRGFILSGKNQDYVIAAQVQGIPIPLIILKHLLPQISSYLIVIISIGVPGYIMMETNLSFLGFGISEPSVSWGLMLSVLRELSIISVATDYPWLLWPAIAVAMTVMAFQLIGDAVRDTLDPMVKR